MERLLRWASWVITLPMMIFSCGPFFSSALRDLRQRRVSMDLPVALGMGITFVVSTAGTFDPAGPFGREVYYDSLTMFVFFLLTGRWLEMRLRDRTAGALEAVMNRLPDSVERRGADGTFTRVGVRRLAAGDVVRVLPGEAFPADGRIDRGSTQVDEAPAHGESTPLPRAEGAAVTAGSYNLSAPVEVRVERVGGDTRFAEIVALMEAASAQKPRLAQLADRIARPFLVGVLLAAGLAAAWWWEGGPRACAHGRGGGAHRDVPVRALPSPRRWRCSRRRARWPGRACWCAICRHWKPWLPWTRSCSTRPARSRGTVSALPACIRRRASSRPMRWPWRRRWRGTRCIRCRARWWRRPGLKGRAPPRAGA